MSTCAHESMTNHHGSGLFAQLNDTVHLWVNRHRQRRELTQWTSRDLHDVGLSWSEVVREAEKPFWRA
jgi:uncharacterized protein YjiS (DUF1127 family)